ncbi:MAG TPA: glycosyltransferase family 87 protein [Ktedonobacterales bacterium]|nr:glycosyltransferase family 87 protein [Ktedonobacterales bacterium]
MKHIPEGPGLASRIDLGDRPSEAGEHAVIPRSRFRRVLTNTCWAILLVLGVFFLVRQIIDVSQGPSDFCNDYLAAQRVRIGLQPYVPLNCFSGGVHAPPSNMEYDTHPPFSILFLLGWSLLPLQPATMLWGVWCLIGYGASGFFLLRQLGWGTLRNVAFFTLGSILWLPFLYSEQLLNLGQTLTLFVVGAWILERRRQDTLSGVLIGLAGLLKLWPAGLLLYSLLFRRWRQALSGGITFVLGILLTLLVPGIQAYINYLGPVQHNEQSAVPSDVNMSVVAVVARPFTGIPGALPPLIPGVELSAGVLLGEILAGVVLSGGLGLIWWCTRHTSSETTAWLSYGLLVTLLLLIFPVNPFWGQVSLILPLATTIAALRHLPRPPRTWYVLFALGLAEPLGAGWFIPGLMWKLVLNGTLTRAGWETLVFDMPGLMFLLIAGAQAWLLWWASQNRSQPL